MITRKFSLLLPGFALLATLALPTGTAHARTISPLQTDVSVVVQEEASTWQYAGDKKKPKPTPGPQDGDD